VFDDGSLSETLAKLLRNGAAAARGAPVVAVYRVSAAALDLACGAAAARTAGVPALGARDAEVAPVLRALGERLAVQYELMADLRPKPGEGAAESLYLYDSALGEAPPVPEGLVWRCVAAFDSLDFEGSLAHRPPSEVSFVSAEGDPARRARRAPREGAARASAAGEGARLARTRSDDEDGASEDARGEKEEEGEEEGGEEAEAEAGGEGGGRDGDRGEGFCLRLSKTLDYHLGVHVAFRQAHTPAPSNPPL
jgi:hypothetical protein